MDTKQPERLLPSYKTLMAQAQVFASAWAIAGGRLDTGDGMEVADQEKSILADMFQRLHAENETLHAENEALRALAERIKQEAQIHAMEARTANATIAEIYQCVSGATGEPGNWHGAEPVHRRIAELVAQLEAVCAGGVGPLFSAPAQPVAGQSRFKGDDEWGWCSHEHVTMALATPSAWEGYEVRYLYAAPQPAAQALDGALLQAVTDARDWFEQQSRAVSKGCGSSYELHDLRTQRDLLDTAIAATKPKGPTTSITFPQ